VSERTLALRCADGDPAAWTELVETYDRRVLLVLLRTVGSGFADELPDLRQEVWARLLARRGAALRGLRAEREGALGAFVAQVALRVGIDFGRARGTRAAAEVSEEEAHALQATTEAPDEAASQRQRRVRLEQALLRAAEGANAQRDLLVLRAHFRDGLNPVEIGRLNLGLSAKGVETLLYRARARIEEALAPLSFASPPQR
jgi:RNA polymerase sigma factor (sigma-70 family)